MLLLFDVGGSYENEPTLENTEICGNKFSGVALLFSGRFGIFPRFRRLESASQIHPPRTIILSMSNKTPTMVLSPIGRTSFCGNATAYSELYQAMGRLIPLTKDDE